MAYIHISMHTYEFHINATLCCVVPAEDWNSRSLIFTTIDFFFPTKKKLELPFQVRNAPVRVLFSELPYKNPKVKSFYPLKKEQSLWKWEYLECHWMERCIWKIAYKHISMHTDKCHINATLCCVVSAKDWNSSIWKVTGWNGVYGNILRTLPSWQHWNIFFLVCLCGTFCHMHPYMHTYIYIIIVIDT